MTFPLAPAVSLPSPTPGGSREHHRDPEGDTLMIVEA